MIEPPPDRRSRALLVFPATSYRPDAFFAAARALDIELVAMTDRVEAARRFACETALVDFAAATFGTIEPVDGVIAVDEPSAIIAARVAREQRCPYHDLDGVIAAADKGAMRARLAAAGVPQPAVFARIPRSDAPLPRVPFPCVVKPPRLTGSQGVIRADDPRSFATAVQRVRAILHRHPRAPGADEGFFELVVEAYVEGPEAAVEGLMSSGRLVPVAIFDKPDPLEGPFFEETIYVTPSAHPPLLQAELYRVTERAARAMGLTDGPVHAELRLTERGPALIEIAARSIGGLCSRALHHVVGSLEAWLLCHAVGRDLPPRPAEPSASGVMMIPVPRSGVLRAIDGVERARAIAGVDAVSLSLAPGDIVRAAPDGGSYLGFIFAHAATPSAVTTILHAAHRALRFEITPLLPVTAF